MEPQHFMLCWSCVIADMQSANCKPKKATSVTTMSILFLIALMDSDSLRRASQRKDTALAQPRNANVSKAVRFFAEHLLNIRPQMGGANRRRALALSKIEPTGAEGTKSTESRRRSKKLCHNCDTKPVFTAKTDFIDKISLLILRNLLKTQMRSKIPAYMARPLFSTAYKRQGFATDATVCSERTYK